jgi:hypothetical protein
LNAELAAVRRILESPNVALHRAWLMFIACGATCPGSGAEVRADAPVGAVEVELVDGPVRSGRLIALDAERVILDSATNGELPLRRSDVLCIRLPVAADKGRTPAAWLLFPNGDRASLAAQRIEDESLICLWRSYPVWEPLRVPLETVSGLIVNPPGSSGGLRSLLRELSHGPFDTDMLILSNRDRLSGELKGLSPEHYELSTPVGPIQAATPQIHAVAFNSSLVSFPRVPADTVLATLIDGSWLTLAAVQLDASGTLSGKTLFGEPVAFPVGSIESLLLCGPRVCFVSTLVPSRSATQPYLAPAVSSPPHLNRNDRGGYLALRGREFPRGIGVTSASRFTYPLNREFLSFRATIGIDDEADGGGSAVFAVEVDGRRLYTSPLVTGRSRPIDVGPLDLSQVNELTLIVDYGEYGDILDVADWANAVLVRPRAP